MEFLYAYKCSAELYSLSGGREKSLSEPFVLLSTDRLSTVRYRLARHLNTDPSMLYIEIHTEEGLRVVPFQYTFNERYGRQYTEEISYRAPPEQYAQQSDKVFRIGPMVISRALLHIGKQHPRLTPQRASHLLFNGDALEHFFPRGQQLIIRALCMSEQDAEGIKQYREDIDYQFAIGCSLLKYFPSLLIHTPGYTDIGAFEAEQHLMGQVAAKLEKPQTDKPEYRFNVKTVDVWHEMDQDINLRHVFNEIVVSKDIQFARHVFVRKDKLFVATKCSINENPDVYYFPLMKSAGDAEHLMFGGLRSDTFRIFKTGRIMVRCVINKAQTDPDCSKFKEYAAKRLSEFVEYINSLPSQYVPLEIRPDILRFNAQIGIYIQQESVQPVHSLRAIQSVLASEEQLSQQVESMFTIRSNVLCDTRYAVHMQYSQEYLLVDYEGALVSQFYTPFVLIAYALSEQFSKHSSSNIRKRDYHEAHDPELYSNLSQRFSRLCQGDHKPLMTQKEGPNTYKYWNFTTKQPQLYKCPDQYPHLYFITGRHKQNYCVPCCAVSKAPAEVSKQCFDTHTYTRRQADKKQYVLQTENMFQLGRHTALPKQLAAQFDFHTSAILCLTVPGFVPIKEQVLSLARCIAHSLHMPDLVQKIVSRGDQEVSDRLSIRVWVDFAARLVSRVTQQKTSLLIVDLDQKSFYAPIFNQLIICAALTRQAFNPVHFGNKYRVPISTFRLASALITHVEQQMSQTPEQVIALVQKNALRIRQIVDQEGVCRYIVGEAKNNKTLMLPTLPQLVDSVPEQRTFPDPDDLVLDVASALGHLEQVGLTPQQKILDEDGFVCGLIASGLLFPVHPQTSHDGIESLQVYSSRVNPLRVNQQLVEFLSERRPSLGKVFLSLYTDYLYELLIMQDPGREQDIQFMPTEQLVAYLQKRAGGAPVPTELRSCKRDSDQFFCDGQKIVLSETHRELVREVNRMRRLLKDVPTPVSLIIAEIEFKCLPSEHIRIDFIGNYNARGALSA